MHLADTKKTPKETHTHLWGGASAAQSVRRTWPGCETDHANVLTGKPHSFLFLITR